MIGRFLGGGVASAVEGFAAAIDRFVETDEERKAAELLKAKMAARPAEAQIELNKIEAQHRSIFVAGWRPCVGWVCAAALAWHFILSDLTAWVCAAAGWPAPPALAGTETLVTVLMSLLGLGALRTAEKFGGRAK